ncbi:glycosyltransferase family 4 protein [Mucilaginibacter sp. HMF5004]|uniref:glycosyltransferase family 4 protein n=1 Tax=Mucilaginibacter rivuli TaxID=2857527 RepID=UPI001C5EA49B|nr:glycosyltransferase family 1 protein [Mucilaginibacter rivuli]MBW4888438.1 glycosyltransferase family 4 protein [Mucilaginibacter rivuli]
MEKDKKPSVLVTVDSMRYPNTGLYYFGRSLGKALAAQNNGQFNLNYYVHADANEKFDEYNVGKVVLKKFDKITFLDEKRFDLYHFADQFSRLKPKKVWSQKKILTIHDINQVHETDIAPEKLKLYLKKLKERIDKSHKIVAISQFSANDVAHYFPEAKNRLSVIYNGADKLELKAGHQPAYLPTGPFLFTIGIVSAKKNAHVLPALLADNNLQLIISGIETDYKQKVLDQAKKFGCEDRVIITGPISDDDRAWYYKNCEAFVFPSVAEGFGLPVIEAMHFGKAVFLSTATSLPEVGGDLAYYFNSFKPEAMQQVFAEGLAHYHAINPAEAIMKHAAKFDWNKTAQQYLQLYHECLAM